MHRGDRAPLPRPQQPGSPPPEATWPPEEAPPAVGRARPPERGDMQACPVPMTTAATPRDPGVGSLCPALSLGPRHQTWGQQAGDTPPPRPFPPLAGHLPASAPSAPPQAPRDPGCRPGTVSPKADHGQGPRTRDPNSPFMGHNLVTPPPPPPRHTRSWTWPWSPAVPPMHSSPAPACSGGHGQGLGWWREGGREVTVPSGGGAPRPCGVQGRPHFSGGHRGHGSGGPVGTALCISDALPSCQRPEP